MAWTLGATLLHVASVAVMAALGVALLRLGPRRKAASWFGAFCLLWAAQVMLIWTWFEVDPTGSTRLLPLLSWAFTLPLPVLLLHFAAMFPRQAPWAQRVPWAVALTVAPVTAVVLFFRDPTSVLALGSGIVWGWATYVFAIAPLLVAFVVAFARFVTVAHASASVHESRQAFWAGVGFLTYLAYLLPAEARSLPAYADGLPPAVAWVYGFVVVTACIVTAAYAWVLVQQARGSGLSAALVLPAAAAAWALMPWPESFGVVPRFAGLWRMLMVAALGYAIAKYDLFDLDLRLRTWAPRGTAVAVGAGAGLTVAAVASAVWGASLAPSGVTTVTAAALGTAALTGVVARPRLARFFDDRFPYVRATSEYRARRRLEVYAVAAAAGASQRHLADLERDLALTPAEREAATRTRAVAADLSGTSRIHDRYRLDRTLARGVHGAVWLAWDERVDEHVVLKHYGGAVATGADRAFAREAKIMGDLAHVNVLAVRDAFRLGDDFFVTTEYAPDGALETRLAGGARLPVLGALDITAQMLHGLAAAHAKNVLHRDLKPANVLFKRDVVKLADFGVAFDPGLEAALRAMTARPGTLAWMAPEQAAGLEAGPASDTFAVGAMLYRMVAGVHYVQFRGWQEGHVRRAILKARPPPPLAGVPPSVNALLEQALAKDTQRRFGDAAAMLRAVKRAKRDVDASMVAAHGRVEERGFMLPTDRTLGG